MPALRVPARLWYEAQRSLPPPEPPTARQSIEARSRQRLRAAACLAAAWPAACGGGAPSQAPPTSQAPPWFENVAAEAGVDFRHHNADVTRWHFPEIMGAGVALFDADDDGDLDLYLVQSGDLVAGPAQAPANRLYRNRGDGTFEDVTETSGAGDRGYGMGCAVGDADGDGDLDLYVTNFGPNVLLENQGDGTFRDVTARSGTGDARWSTSASFFDADGDGDLDLFVANYVDWALEREQPCFSWKDERDYCHPNSYKAPARDTLYRNDGGGHFHDATVEMGLARAVGNGLGVACADFDGDGRTDVYVANDMTANHLWMNSPEGFHDRALLAGCALSGSGFVEAGMGVAALDLESDGDVDLFMSHLRAQSNTFYLNSGQGLFDDATARVGLAGPSVPYTGFGLGFADFDQDADLDLYIANGRVVRAGEPFDPKRPYVEPDLLFEQTEAGRFEIVKPQGGTAEELLARGRGAAFGDLDGDGDVDVVVANNAGPAYVLRNVAPKRGGWIQLDLRLPSGAPAVGATVAIWTGERVQRRLVQPGSSYCSSSDPRAHFGLGEATRVERVLVRWPDGTTTERGPLEAGHTYRIDQKRP